MLRILMILLCAISSYIGFAQGERLVRGVVMATNDTPMSGILVRAVNSSDTVRSGADGRFEFKVSVYTKFIEASAEGYISARAEVDGSYLIIKLEKDDEYWAEKKRKEQEAKQLAARQAEEKAKAEKRAAEEKAKAEERARIAAEKEAAEKAKAEERARIAAEKDAAAKAAAEKRAAEEKAKAEERARIAAEKEAAAKVAAEKRAAEEKAIAVERARIAAEKEAAAKVAAEKRAAEEKAKVEERARIAAKKAEQRKIKAEQNRKLFAEPVKGYSSMVNISYTIKTGYDYLGLDYIGGYRFDNKNFAGIGVGFRYAYNAYSVVLNMINEGAMLPGNTYSVPVFVHYRINFLNGRYSPFFGVSAGVNISTPAEISLDLYDVKYTTIGAFINPQIGFNYRMTKKSSVYLAVGFNGYTMPKCIDNTGYSATFKHSLYYSADVHIGLTF